MTPGKYECDSNDVTHGSASTQFSLVKNLMNRALGTQPLNKYGTLDLLLFKFEFKITLLLSNNLQWQNTLNMGHNTVYQFIQHSS